MPNIGIHGFKKSVAMEWQRRIFEVFEGSGIEKDIYVTIHNTTTTGPNGRDAPFFRLHSTEDTIDQAREVLEKLGIDLETIVPIKFKYGDENISRNSSPPRLTT